ncbi:MAG TPA: ABC transporter permease [Thermoleophilaceae bacterium]|nr:ABC transporter permease [Thermoleophilaceae bacterium]
MSATAATPNEFRESRLERARSYADMFPWVWSFIASIAVWIAIALVAGRGIGGTLTSGLALAPFLVLVGVGQMFVITAGYGAIDLSVPYVMTLTGFISTGIMNGGHGSFLVGFLAAIGCGLLVGVVNIAAIQFLSIPPIVATLATGLMVQSWAAVNAGNFNAEVDPGLHNFVVRQWGPIPELAVFTVVLAAVAGFLLHRTAWGRALQAAGQNRRAANLAGLRVSLVLALAYLICGALAGVSGALLGAYSSPSLGIGDPFLLNSIAVVVIGGSLIQGGRSNVPGVWGGSMFLILLVTLLGVLHINVATQNIVKGGLIVLVLALAGSHKAA